MANNFESNITIPLARVFLEKFETARILSKNVDTQLIANAFNPSTGDTVYVKRPTDYVSVRTPKGDVTAETPSDIITGKAPAVVQDYFTTFVDYDEADEALQMDQLDQLLQPLATRIVTDMELDYAAFMLKNTGLIAGTYGTPASTWDDIAEAGAVLQAHGIPADMPWYYTVNPFTQRTLASDQRSLGAGGTAGNLIDTAHKKATITENFAGFDSVMTATTLGRVTHSAGADRAGTLSASPDATYLTAKDTMTQVLAVEAFEASLVIKAGEVVTVAARNRLNLSTRDTIVTETGGTLIWSGTVTADVTLDAGGAGNLVVTGPAIFEAGGAYNTVDSALTTGDVVTLLGAASATEQPNLFWHKQAFTIGSVTMKKLYATDTIATTEDGLQFRVTRFSDGLANQQKVRFDFRPAYGVMNPFFAGQGFGT